MRGRTTASDRTSGLDGTCPGYASWNWHRCLTHTETLRGRKGPRYWVPHGQGRPLCVQGRGQSCPRQATLFEGVAASRETTAPVVASSTGARPVRTPESGPPLLPRQCCQGWERGSYPDRSRWQSWSAVLAIGYARRLPPRRRGTGPPRAAGHAPPRWGCQTQSGAVSYTHLTLPTIYSV